MKIRDTESDRETRPLIYILQSMRSYHPVDMCREADTQLTICQALFGTSVNRGGGGDEQRHGSR